MQQIPVDFLCEKDLSESGRLKDYRVLYLPANNLPREGTAAIIAWVKKGGTLLVCGGGPERDEVNEPFEGLWPTLGLTGVVMKKDAMNYRGANSPTAGTKVTLAGQSAAIPVGGYHAVLSAAKTAKVLGTYPDGAAAVVEHRLGEGRTLTYGFNPGISLMIAINPAKRPTFWDVFPENELRLISAPIYEAGVLPPVKTRLASTRPDWTGPADRR